MRRFYWGGWGICWFLFAVPFFSIRYAPIVDLPQQVAQIRLWLSVSKESIYTSFWWFPNHLSYAFLGAGWWLGGPLAAGRLGMWLLAGVWLGGLFALAWRVRRGVWLAALVGLSFFNFTMYWGFYSFLLGQAIFFWSLFWWLKEPEERSFLHEILGGLGVGGLLYMGHVLWWGVGMLLVGMGLLRAGWRWRWRLLGLVPSGILVLFWWRAFGELDTTQRLLWGWPWYLRLSPSFLAHFSTGALQGWLEPLFVWGVVGLVCGGTLLRWRAKKTENTEDSSSLIATSLLACAAVLFCLVLFLPSNLGRTAFLGERWMPSVFLLGMLSFRGPSLHTKGLLIASFVAVLGFVLWTTHLWTSIEKVEYSGMDRVLKALPHNPTVLGVDLGRRSRFLKIHRPFVQGMAYCQVLRGGRLNDSFAGLYSSLVVYQRSYRKPWRDGMTWHPRRLTKDAFQHFSHVVVFGRKEQHRMFVARWGLVPLTHQGMWRLYLSRT